MKTIIITGPSGSGKSFLTKNLSKIFKDSIVVKTDSYYRDNIIIKLLSLFKYFFISVFVLLTLFNSIKL